MSNSIEKETRATPSCALTIEGPQAGYRSGIATHMSAETLALPPQHCLQLRKRKTMRMRDTTPASRVLLRSGSISGCP